MSQKLIPNLKYCITASHYIHSSSPLFTLFVPLPCARIKSKEQMLQVKIATVTVKFTWWHYRKYSKMFWVRSVGAEEIQFDIQFSFCFVTPCKITFRQDEGTNENFIHPSLDSCSLFFFCCWVVNSATLKINTSHTEWWEILISDKTYTMEKGRFTKHSAGD